ncbi:hypothetical protein EMCRGX_G030876 [Ephydatia muelleri]
MMNREQAEDLKAFEQRLTECVTHIKGQSRKWRVLLSMLSVCTAAFVINWWMDNSIYETYWDVLAAHKGMVAMIVVLFSFYVFGILDKYTAPQIVTSRCRKVLHDYSMSCDDHGKVILKRPR